MAEDLAGVQGQPRFVVQVNDSNQATELSLCNLRGGVAQNPHMRAWWGATISFFLAFFGWFAFTGIENPWVATSMGICENQLYPPASFPMRPAYLKYKNLNTMLTYCQYGHTATDCNPVPAAIASLLVCDGSNAPCATAQQQSKYRPQALASESRDFFSGPKAFVLLLLVE